MMTKSIVTALTLLITSSAFAQMPMPLGKNTHGKEKYDHHGNALNYSDLPPTNDAGEWKLQNLYSGYRIYYLIKYCYEAREGFAAVYVNDAQLEKARLKAMNLEEDATAAVPSLDTKALWKRAVANTKGYMINFDSCQSHYLTIFKLKSSRNMGNAASTKDF